MAFLVGGANSAADTGYDIENSCRFGIDTYMHKTPAGAGNRRIFTFSAWFKRDGVTSDFIFGGGTASGSYCQLGIQSNKFAFYDASDGVLLSLYTNALLRDPTAWYHLVVGVDTTQGTDTNRVKFYINGVQITSFAPATFPDQNDDLYFGQDEIMSVGTIDYTDGTVDYADGYLAEAVYIDGTQYAASDFGEFDEDSGIWKPKDVSELTFGTNGFYLDFKDSANLGNDANGGTDLTEVNLAATNQCTDTPTNNFSTMKIHGAAAVSGAVLAEGNLKCTTGTSGSGRDLGRIFISTILMSTGKWYWEAKVADTNAQMGLSAYQGSRLGNTTNNTRFLVLNNAGTVADKADSSESTETYMAATSADDIVQFALDMDADPKVMYFGNGGSWGDGSGNTDESSPSSGMEISGGAHDILTDTTDNAGFIGFSFHSSGGGSSAVAQINFGNPSFAISSGNADANGYGNFEYEVPSGYYALCTKNLAEFG